MSTHSELRGSSNEVIATQSHSTSTDSYMMMETKSRGQRHPPRPPPITFSHNRHRNILDEEEPIFHLEQMTIPKDDLELSLPVTKPLNFTKSPSCNKEEFTGNCDSISPLSQEDQRKYKKGNKHKGDYCFVDLGLGEDKVGSQAQADKKRSSSFSNHRSWKTLTFNKK